MITARELIIKLLSDLELDLDSEIVIVSESARDGFDGDCRPVESCIVGDEQAFLNTGDIDDSYQLTDDDDYDKS